MANRVYIAAVVVLWLSSMAWLVTERILPSFYGGQPPIAQAYEDGQAVAWQVKWKGHPVGTAASVRLPGIDGSTDLYNRVVLDEFPVMELAPAWIRATVGEIGSMSFDVFTRVEFDPLGKFSSFNSRISLNDLPSVLKINGRIADTNLKLKIRSGDIKHTTQIYLPNSETMSEVLFPEAKLPYLRVGRSWQEKVYSPFSSPTNPVERVQVEVVEKESMEFDGEVRQVFRVEYKSLMGSGVTENARTQGIAWVESKSGNVLRRMIHLGEAKLCFERLPKQEAAVAGLSLFEDQLFIADALSDEEPSTDEVSAANQ